MLNAQTRRDYDRLLEWQDTILRARMAEGIKAAYTAFKSLHKRERAFSDWFFSSHRGELHTYYKSISPVSVARMEDGGFDMLCDFMRALADAGYLFMVQQKDPKAPAIAYQVRRSSKGFIPALAMGGRVGSSASPADTGRFMLIDRRGGFSHTGRNANPRNGSPREHYGESNDSKT